MSGLAWTAVMEALALGAYAIPFARLVRFVNGPTIPSGRERSALLLVDMQSEHFEGEHPENETRLLDAAKDAVSDARAAASPIIALRHGWQTPGTRLMAHMMLGGKGLAQSLGLDLTSARDHHPTRSQELSGMRRRVRRSVRSTLRRRRRHKDRCSRRSMPFKFTRGALRSARNHLRSGAGTENSEIRVRILRMRGRPLRSLRKWLPD